MNAAHANQQFTPSASQLAAVPFSPPVPPQAAVYRNNMIPPAAMAVNDEMSLASSVAQSDSRSVGSKQKKRSRDGGAQLMNLQEEEEDKKNRGNYRCSRCNLPKKGHVCPFQPRYRRKEANSGDAASSVGNACAPVPMCDSEAQVELDFHMTVRALGDDLSKQGLPESYAPQSDGAHHQQHAQQIPPAAVGKTGMGTLNDSFQHIRMDS